MYKFIIRFVGVVGAVALVAAARAEIKWGEWQAYYTSGDGGIYVRFGDGGPWALKKGARNTYLQLRSDYSETVRLELTEEFVTTDLQTVRRTSTNGLGAKQTSKDLRWVPCFSRRIVAGNVSFPLRKKDAKDKKNADQTPFSTNTDNPVSESDGKKIIYIDGKPVTVEDISAEQRQKKIRYKPIIRTPIDRGGGVRGEASPSPGTVRPDDATVALNFLLALNQFQQQQLEVSRANRSKDAAMARANANQLIDLVAREGVRNAGMSQPELTDLANAIRRRSVPDFASIVDAIPDPTAYFGRRDDKNRTPMMLAFKDAEGFNGWAGRDTRFVPFFRECQRRGIEVFRPTVQDGFSAKNVGIGLEKPHSFRVWLYTYLSSPGMFQAYNSPDYPTIEAKAEYPWTVVTKDQTNPDELRLLAAIRDGDDKWIKECLREDFDVEFGDAMNDAALFGDTSRLMELASLGASIDASDHLGWTPILSASEAGDAETIDFLLDMGADATAKNAIGQNALHLLFSRRTSEPASKEVVAALIAKGVDPNERDRAGARVLDYIKVRDDTNQNQISEIKDWESYLKSEWEKYRKQPKDR